MTAKGTRIVVLLVVCASSAALAQDAATTTDLSCVTSLKLPTHGFLAARAGTSGVVTAKIHIGDAGRVAELRFVSDNRYLQGEVQVAIELSTFAAQCDGRVLELVFSFTLEDPPADTIIPPAVQFLPPNRFALIFRRVKPSHDPGSPRRSPKPK